MPCQMFTNKRLPVFKLPILLGILFTNTLSQIHAQNPLGLYLDIDGQVEFWETEANLNGNVDDTVIATFQGKQEILDLRNLKLEHLTFVDAPRHRDTDPSNIDPSRRYDTAETEVIEPIETDGLFFNIIPTLWSSDSITIADSTDQAAKPKHFLDDVRGLGLTDSALGEIKAILDEYIIRYTGQWEPNESRDSLNKKLSVCDSFVEYLPYYDYLVDLYVKYEYNDKEQLARVIGYHWDLGVEVDRLAYDKKGRLIYFCRDKIGSVRTSFRFSYNRRGKVKEMQKEYNTTGPNKESSQYMHPEFSTMRFSYGKNGLLNAQSYLKKDGTWNCVHYKIRSHQPCHFSR